MHEFNDTDIQTDRWMDTGCDIVASAMKQIATKTHNYMFPAIVRARSR